MPKTIFFNFLDGRFSNLLEETLAKGEIRQAEQIFNTLTAFMEAKAILSKIDEPICFINSAKVDTLLQDLTQRFLKDAEQLFNQYWSSASQKLLKCRFFERMKLRFEAIRVLKLAQTLAGQTRGKMEFTTLYKENICRFFAMGGTVHSVEDQAVSAWEGHNYDLAIEVLQAGIIFHETARFAAGTDILQELLAKYTLAYSQMLMDQADQAIDIRAAEELSVRALKVLMVGHGVRKEILKILWERMTRTLVERMQNLKADLDDLKQKGLFEQARNQLQNQFWFLPTSLNASFDELKTSLITSCARDSLTKAEETTRVIEKLRHIQKALQISPGWHEALAAKDKLLAAHLLSGEVMDMVVGQKQYRWFAKNDLAIARETGDLRLMLKSASDFPKYVGLFQTNEGVFVVDHNTTHGVYLKNNGGAGQLSVQGRSYEKLTPGTSYGLQKEGELLIGLIGRIAFKQSPEGLVFSFLAPYAPRAIDPTIQVSVNDLWPDWQKWTGQSYILASSEITLGANAECMVQADGFGSTKTRIKKNGHRYQLITQQGEVTMEDLQADCHPVLATVPYTIGNAMVYFNPQ